MQNEKGFAKVYQVRQLLEAVEKRLTQLSAEVREMGTPSHEREPPPGAARKEKKKRKKPKK